MSRISYVKSHLTEDEVRDKIATAQTEGRTGKNPRAYLTFEQEAAFLESFSEAAKNGHLTTIQQIQQAFETNVGSQVAPSTLYRLLERHGWRKLGPRPYHPEDDKAAQETFKKTSPIWFKPP